METVSVLVALLAVLHNSSAGFAGFSGTFDKCSGDPDPYSCLKVKAVNILDRALATDSLSITDFVTVTKDPKAKDDSVPDQPKGDIEASLPRDLQEKSSALDNMVLDRISKYLGTRTIQLSMPNDVFEGREKGFKGYKKGSKGGGIYLVMFGAMGALLLQLATAALALIAGKALLIGKVALLLAGVLGLKSLLSHDDHEKHPTQVIYAEPEMHHGGWSRSTQVPEAAHDIAYRGQRSMQS